MKTRIAIWIALAGAPLLRAQTPAALPVDGPAEFELASVRAAPAGGMTSISPPGSRGFTAKNTTMQILISLATGVDSERVTGPSWIEAQQYDVTARAEGNPSLNYQQLRAPLLKLLRDRFQLAFHTGTKEASGFALIAAKGGPKLQPSKGGEPHAYILKTGLDLRGATLDVLAGTLSHPGGKPVVNETGIAGSYDIQLKYAPPESVNSSLPSLFTALQEQLGLQLVSRKVPVTTVIVDRVERTPAEN